MFAPQDVDVPRLLSVLGIDAEHQGDRWLARCPSGAHPDRKPSWDILDLPGTEKNGLHVCRSCGFGGTAIDLVVHRVGITREGAVGFIAERAMGAPDVPRAVRADWKLPAGFALPPEVVVAPVASWPETPRRYLLDRGVLPEQVTRWGIGYALYGALAGRIVIPARDKVGRVLNYTARSFAGHAKRYLNARDADGPDASAVFGEQHWPAINVRPLVVVTEGALNALAVERVWRSPVAALFGSSVRLAHVGKIATFGAALILTDPDLAGDRAGEKLAAAIKGHVDGLRLARVELPRGTDADSVEPAELRRALGDAWRRMV